MARKRKAQIGDLVERKDKLTGKKYQWARVRDRIDASPLPDGTIYSALLCDGHGDRHGQVFIWRPYFTPNRYGNLHYGQYSPQAPLEVDRWLAREIEARGWYSSLGAPKQQTMNGVFNAHSAGNHPPA
jgi:hypothetical protein